MAQRQLQRRRLNYVFSFDARKAFDTAPHDVLPLMLRHLSVPPEVIYLLLILHTAARLRIATAHRLTQPVHMLHGVRQANPESPLLYALLLEFLLRAQGRRQRLPGEAERGLIQAYIDDLLVVAHTLQHFVEGVEAVAAYLGMMGMELNRRNCAMATTEGVPVLQLRLSPHLENPWHWVPAVESVPYMGLWLQPDGEFSLQRKQRLRLVTVHHAPRSCKHPRPPASCSTPLTCSKPRRYTHWGCDAATVGWLPPGDRGTRLTVAHFTKGGPTYDDALCRLGDIP